MDLVSLQLALMNLNGSISTILRRIEKNLELIFARPYILGSSRLRLGKLLETCDNHGLKGWEKKLAMGGVASICDAVLMLFAGIMGLELTGFH